MSKYLHKVQGDILHVPDKYLGHTQNSNASLLITREKSSENIFTNNRGWRVIDEKKNVSGKRKYLLFGCSWPMGLDIDYKHTYCFDLEKKLKAEIANLGVSSYSILQSIRRLELEIKFIKPKVVILNYGFWLANRLFKNNQLEGFFQRPIFKYDKQNKNIVLIEPKTIPLFLLRLVTKISRKKNAGRVNLFNKTIYCLLKIISFFFLNFSIKKIFSSKKLSYISTENSFNYSNCRIKALEYSFKKLSKIVDKNNCKILVSHIYPFFFNNEEKKISRNDEIIIKKILKNYKNIIYEDSVFMKKKCQKILKKKNLKLPFSNHPNSDGHKVISDLLYTYLKKYNLIY